MHAKKYWLTETHTTFEVPQVAMLQLEKQQYDVAYRLLILDSL
jgi:hypothetical protein